MASGKNSEFFTSQFLSKQATSEIKLANLLNQRVIALFSASEFSGYRVVRRQCISKMCYLSQFKRSCLIYANQTCPPILLPECSEICLIECLLAGVAIVWSALICLCSLVCCQPTKDSLDSDVLEIAAKYNPL